MNLEPLSPGALRDATAQAEAFPDWVALLAVVTVVATLWWLGSAWFAQQGHRTKGGDES